MAGFFERSIMIRKLRDNLYLGDKDAYKTLDELKDLGITSVVVVADDFVVNFNETNQNPRIVKIGLRSDRMNPPHIKDLACHIPKYMMQNGEIVLIQSMTGLQRGGYIACRTLCEFENKTLYEIMMELKRIEPAFDMGKSYF